MERHPGREILMCLDGVTEYAMGKKIYRVQTGTAVLIPGWTMHSKGYQNKDADLIHLWVNLDSYRCPCFMVRNNEPYSLRKFAFPAPAELMALLNSRWTRWEKAGAPPEQCEHYLLNVMNAILDEMLLAFGSDHTEQLGADIVQNMISTIRYLYGKNCTLESLARISGCSKYHLAHLVKRETGRTIGSFIDEARINYIKSAQLHGVMHKEIASALGFSSPSAFGNWMRKNRNRFQNGEDDEII